jgi:hypothetical protein
MIGKSVQRFSKKHALGRAPGIMRFGGMSGGDNGREGAEAFSLSLPPRFDPDRSVHGTVRPQSNYRRRARA